LVPAGHQRWSRLPRYPPKLSSWYPDSLLSRSGSTTRLSSKSLRERSKTRATTIRTYDGRRIVIPNSELFTNSVTVNTARKPPPDVGIGYGDDIDLAKQLLEAIHSVNGVLKDPAPDAGGGTCGK